MCRPSLLTAAQTLSLQKQSEGFADPETDQDMRVLIVGTSDLQGGAAIAAYRLLNALTKAGIDARMAVRDKQSDNNLVVKIGSDRRNKLNFIANVPISLSETDSRVKRSSMSPLPIPASR